MKRVLKTTVVLDTISQVVNYYRDRDFEVIDTSLSFVNDSPEVLELQKPSKECLVLGFMRDTYWRNMVTDEFKESDYFIENPEADYSEDDLLAYVIECDTFTEWYYDWEFNNGDRISDCIFRCERRYIDGTLCDIDDLWELVGFCVLYSVEDDEYFLGLDGGDYEGYWIRLFSHVGFIEIAEVE